MSLPIQLKSIKFTYSLLMVFFLSTTIVYPLFADGSDSKETFGNLSARIEELENQMNGQGGVDDRNPGAHVTIEDLERLRDEVRALKDARQNSPEDMSRLQDEVRSLREDISQLRKENSSLRLQSGSKKTVPAPSDSLTKSKDEPWVQTQTPSSAKTASRDTPLEKNDETESVLKLLEQSAPEDEEEEDTQSSSRKKHDKNKNLEMIRETATKHAEETAPNLPAGNAQAQYNEAFALHDKGAYKEAERAFEYFIKTYPNDPLVPKAMYWKAESCLKQNKYKEAKILFAHAYKKNPTGPKAPHCLLKLGEALAMQGRKEDACTIWLKLKKDFSYMTKEMKSTLTALKKKYECEKNSETASKSVPKN